MRGFGWLLLVLGMSLALVAAACGDDDDDDAETGDDAGPASATAAATTPAAPATMTPAGGDASGGETVIVTDDDELGAIITDAEGVSLYTFEPDEPGVSNCAGDCAAAWPPLVLDSGEPVAGEGVGGELTLIERDDGTMQVALDGQPLYYFAGDAAPGDTNGEGVGGVWFVVEAGDSASAPAATATVRPLSTGY